MKKLLSLVSTISIIVPSAIEIALSSSNLLIRNEIFSTSQYVKTNDINLKSNNIDYFYSAKTEEVINNITFTETTYLYGSRNDQSIYVMVKDETNQYVEKEFIKLSGEPKQVYVYNNFLHVMMSDESGKVTDYYENISDLIEKWRDINRTLTVDDFNMKDQTQIYSTWNIYISTHLGFAIFGYGSNNFLAALSKSDGKIYVAQSFNPETVYGDNKDFSEIINISMTNDQKNIGFIKTDQNGETIAINNKNETFDIKTKDNDKPVVTTYISNIGTGITPTIRNFIFDNERIVEIDVFATTGQYVIEKGEVLTFPDGAKVKSSSEVIDLKSGNQAIYTVTDKGIYLLVSKTQEHLIPTDINTYTVEKLAEQTNNLSEGAIRVAGNTISSFNYNTKTIEQVVKQADLSALNNEKIALDSALLAQGVTKEIQEEIVNQIISIATLKGIQDQISLVSTTDLYNLISIDDVIRTLNPIDSYGTWYKEKVYTIGEAYSYINGANISFSSNTQLEFLKTQTLEYSIAIEAGLINDSSAIQTIVAELNKQLQSKDKNLEIVVPSSIDVQENQAINFDVKPIEGLNVDSSLKSQVQVKFTNVKTAMDLDVIVNQIQAKGNFDVKKTLDTASSVSDFEKFLNNAIQDIKDIDKTLVKITDPSVNVANDYSWTANVTVTEKEMPTNSKKIQVKFTNIAKAKIQMTGTWEQGADPNKFILGQTMKYNINNSSAFDEIRVSSSNDNFSVAESNGVVSINAIKAGNATIEIASDDAINTIKLNLTSYVATLDYGTETDFSLNEGKTKTFKLNNAVIFSNFIIDNQSSDNLKISVDNNGTIKVKALKFEEEGLTYDFTIKATNSLGEQQSQSFTVELLEKVPFPLWAIILLAIIGGAAILTGIGFLIWLLFAKLIIPARKQKAGKYSSKVQQTTTTQSNSFKSRTIKPVKFNQAKGIKRSGLFEHELEYNLDKINDPNYDKKYVWVQDEGTEDNSPVINNWNTDKQQTKEENKNQRKKKIDK